MTEAVAGHGLSPQRRRPVQQGGPRSLPGRRRGWYTEAVRSIPWGAHLVQLERFGLLFPVSCYLVREDDGLTLVDTGMAGSAGGILAAARALGAPIRRIALTHPHVDHAGALDALQSATALLALRPARLAAGHGPVLTDPVPAMGAAVAEAERQFGAPTGA